MDIDKIVNKIIRLLKNDYLFDVDDEEEYAIKSDIVDILLDEHNELTTLLIQQRDLIDRCIFHKMYPACCTDKIQVFENREQYMNFIKINNTIWRRFNTHYKY